MRNGCSSADALGHVNRRLAAIQISGGQRPLFKGEADFQRDLISVDLAAVDVAADLHDLEPSKTAQCPRGFGDCIVDRFGDALLRGANNFNDLIDRIGHFALPGVDVCLLSVLLPRGFRCGRLADVRR